MDDQVVGNEMHNVKDFSLHLKVDNIRSLVAEEQGRGKVSENVMGIVLSKAKEATRKWISIVFGREVRVKDKIEHYTSFAPHESPNKTDFTEDLEHF